MFTCIVSNVKIHIFVIFIVGIYIFTTRSFVTNRKPAIFLTVDGYLGKPLWYSVSCLRLSSWFACASSLLITVTVCSYSKRGGRGRGCDHGLHDTYVILSCQLLTLDHFLYLHYSGPTIYVILECSCTFFVLSCNYIAVFINSFVKAYSIL